MYLEVVSFIKDEHRVLPNDFAKAHPVLGVYKVVVRHEDNVC